MDPQLHFALILGALHTTTFLAVWGFFSILFHRGIGKRFQVANGSAADAKLSKRSRLELITGHLIFPLLMYFVVYPLWVLRGGDADAAPDAPVMIALHILAFILIQDTIFYWSHRTLHRPWFYKRIHVRHHYFRYVRVPVAEFAHPVENALNFVAFFAGPILLGSPLSTLAIFVAIRIAETTEAHSGYAFSPIASRHSFHHLYAAKGCYGSFISPWDMLLGTDKQWRAWRERQNDPA